MRATGRSFIASSTSVQVISEVTMLSAMASEGSFLLSFRVRFVAVSWVGGDRACLMTSLPQTLAVDLAPVVLGQGGGELHDPRVLERGQVLLHEVLELPGQRVAGHGVAPAHHESFGFDQAFGVFIPD